MGTDDEIEREIAQLKKELLELQRRSGQLRERIQHLVMRLYAIRNGLGDPDER